MNQQESVTGVGSGTVSALKPVKTAIVGTGMISNIYIKNLLHMFKVIDLVAVCNRHREAAEEKAKLYGVPKVMTIDEIATDPEIELVVNLTGPDAHYGVIKQMLEHGKHVYTEKMFTTDLDQARELVDLAQSKGLLIGVAPDTVLGAGLQTARKMIDSGMIGQVTSGFVSINRNQSLNSELFRFLQHDGGALPYDVGIYYIGALVSLLGSVKSVRGYGAPAPLHQRQMLYQDNPDSWQISGNNLVVAGLEFDNGTLVSLHFDGNTIGNELNTFRIYGTEGILEIGDPNEFDGAVKLLKPEGEATKMPFTHGYDGKDVTGNPTPFDGSGHRGIGVAEMAYSIRLERENRLSMNYGLHCEEILIGIDRAAESGSTYVLKSKAQVRPLASGYYCTMWNGHARADAERSLMS